MTGSCSDSVESKHKEVLLPLASRLQSRTVSGVLFDLCGVLYDGSHWYRWLHQLLARMGLSLQLESFTNSWEEEYLPRVHLGHLDYWEAMREYLRSLGLANAQIDEVQAAGIAKRRDCERNSLPFPSVRETLTLLSHQNLTLGVSCSRSISQREAVNSVRALRLHHHFFVITSRLVSNESDLTRLHLKSAANQMNLEPERIAYVGCHQVPLQTAAEFGMLAIAFNASDEVRVDHQIDQFDQVISFVGSSKRQLLAG